MATIYQHRESKYWFARYTDPSTGKRVSRSTKTESKKDAKRIAGKLEGQARDAALRADAPAILRRAVELASLESQSGTLTIGRAEDLIRMMAAAANPCAAEGSFRRLAGSWLDRVEKDIAPESWFSYSAAVKAVCAALGERADLPLRRLTQADLEAVQGTLAATGASGATTNKRLSLVGRILQTAVDSGTLDRNPCAGLDSVSTSDSKTRLPFTLDEVRRLLEAAPDAEWKGLIMFAATTGLRCADLRSLTAENIVDGWLVVRPAKTSRSTGTIVKAPLTSACLQWTSGRTGDLFPSLKGMDKRRVADQFEKIMDKAGVPKKAATAPGVEGVRSFHSLRHSFVAWLAGADVPEDVRMKLSGHSSAKVHQGYSHHTESLQRAVALLPKL